MRSCTGVCLYYWCSLGETQGLQMLLKTLCPLTYLPGIVTLLRCDAHSVVCNVICDDPNGGRGLKWVSLRNKVVLYNTSIAVALTSLGPQLSELRRKALFLILILYFKNITISEIPRFVSKKNCLILIYKDIKSEKRSSCSYLRGRDHGN